MVELSVVALFLVEASVAELSAVELLVAEASVQTAEFPDQSAVDRRAHQFWAEQVVVDDLRATTDHQDKAGHTELYVISSYYHFMYIPTFTLFFHHM